MLSLTNIALRRGPELLFENVTFTLHAGQKLGLIGANGAGKTSLFKMILGELEPDHGELEILSGIRIAHLAQEVPGSDEQAVDYVLAGDSELLEILSALEAAEASEDYARVAPLHEALDNIDGYSARARAEQLMAGLGFDEDDAGRALSAFSGGWRIRLNLARALMKRSDLLLLDEPTNHLDLDAIVWLSNWIKQYQGAMLLISHDREFLDESVTTIAHLRQRRIEVISGNYTQFERIKAARLAEQQSQYTRQQQEIKHMEDFVRRFRAKATKARQAQSRLKALERMSLIAPAHVDSPFHFTIPLAERISNPLLALKQCDLGYATAVLSGVQLSLQPGDRIGLLGHNGAGKSTLMKSISGEIPTLNGTRVAGANTRIGYFSQHQVDDLDLTATALNHLTRIDNELTEQRARDYLGGFDFSGDKVKAPVATFSGGEKARLALAAIAFRRPNLLLLDEPTNHLDIEMRQALTVALQDFAGAIVLISHDRHLLSNTVDAFLLVDDGRVAPYDGDLDDYRARLLGRANGDAAGARTAPVRKVPEKVAPAVDFRAGRKTATRLKTIEKRLERLNRKLAEVEEKLADPALYQSPDDGGLQSLLRDQLNLKHEIEIAEEEWLTLSE